MQQLSLKNDAVKKVLGLPDTRAHQKFPRVGHKMMQVEASAVCSHCHHDNLNVDLLAPDPLLSQLDHIIAFNLHEHTCHASEVCFLLCDKTFRNGLLKMLTCTLI